MLLARGLVRLEEFGHFSLAIYFFSELVFEVAARSNNNDHIKLYLATTSSTSCNLTWVWHCTLEYDADCFVGSNGFKITRTDGRLSLAVLRQNKFTMDWLKRLRTTNCISSEIRPYRFCITQMTVPIDGTHGTSRASSQRRPSRCGWRSRGRAHQRTAFRDTQCWSKSIFEFLHQCSGDVVSNDYITANWGWVPLTHIHR